jgi:phospholipid/cholesterol/gamma-HCH transport system substrate-binding protein
MAVNNIEFRVGVIIVLGLAVLFGSLYWLQGRRLERNAQRIKVSFQDVGTLAIGDRVTVSGVQKGKVDGLALTSSGVDVELMLYDDVILNRDATFIIRNLGLMGERFVAVLPGTDSSARLDLTRTSVGSYDVGLPEVMGLMGEMIVELRSLVHSLKQTVASDTSLTKVSNTVANLESVSKSLASYVSRNTGKMDQIVEDFASASRDVRRMISRNSPLVDSTASRIERATVDLETFVIGLDTLSHAARQFADRLNNPDGTLSLLTEDRKLYDDLCRTAKNLEELISDVRANPKKYMNLTVEIF